MPQKSKHPSSLLALTLTIGAISVVATPGPETAPAPTETISPCFINCFLASYPSLTECSTDQAHILQCICQDSTSKFPVVKTCLASCNDSTSKQIGPLLDPSICPLNTFAGTITSTIIITPPPPQRNSFYDITTITPTLPPTLTVLPIGLPPFFTVFRSQLEPNPNPTISVTGSKTLKTSDAARRARGMFNAGAMLIELVGLVGFFVAQVL